MTHAHHNHRLNALLLPLLIFAALLLATALPSTAGLDSSRFLAMYALSLTALAGGCWLSLKGRLPVPVWMMLAFGIATLVGLPVIKLTFA